MARNIYALLVGINDYDPASYPPVPPLQGCIRDIEAIKDYLYERVNREEYRLIEPTNQKWILLNQDATRQAIIEGFQNHLCNAGSDDVVLFYYAGHGAQEKAPEEFWHIEPDHLDETLVCYNSRTEGNWDLADKELSYLIAKVAEKQPHVLIILDCCHSGSGTRDGSAIVGVRTAPIDIRERSLQDFIFVNERSIVEHLLTKPEAGKRTTSLVLPRGKHVLLAACRDHQEAKEYPSDDGQPRGAFSYFLLQALQRTNGNTTYRDLARTINALVSGKVKDQSPQLEATDPKELNHHFLGQGAIKERPNYFILRQEHHRRWTIDGGVLHGIPKSSSGENTLLAIFPVSDEERLRHLTQPIAEARIAKVLANQSVVEITQGAENLSGNEPYWAVITALSLERLKIYPKGEEAGINAVQQVLEQAHSLYLELVTQPENADYHLLVQNGQYWITSPIDDHPLVAPVPNQPHQLYTPSVALEIIRRLESIARWTNILTLPTPATSKIKPNDVEMQIDIIQGYEATPDQANLATETSDLRLEYVYEENQWKLPVLQVKLINHTSKPLYCNILDLAENYAVGTPFFEDRSSVRIPPYGEIESVQIGLIIPESYLEQGITEYKDIFKLLVSTTEFDASLLEQDGLELPTRTRSVTTSRGFLNRLMDQVFTRQAVAIKNETIDDWMTKEITITVVRPQDAKAVSPEQDIVLQNGIVKLLRHPTLQANASLTTVPQVRSLGSSIIPAILQSNASVAQPFQFTTSRGGDPGLSALELSNVQNPDAVTPDTPLKLEINTQLGEGEYLLPIAYDGEFFLPLGRAKQINNKTEIILDRLPTPQQLPDPVASRSLSGSTWIFFQKVFSQKLGRSFNYPKLAIAEVIAVQAEKSHKVDYKVQYIDSQSNQEQVKAEVAKAQRIILVIHGLIGSTQNMLPSLLLAKVEQEGEEYRLKDLYDLVLAFDYENLNTPIEENAKLLGERLQEIGLGANHGKELHVIAYSMGGLISRWFIEREGGNQVVQHLVMLGTPNAGSPWPAIEEWVLTTLAVGLNQLASIMWPAEVIAILLDFLNEKATIALNQMQPDSSFIQQLRASPIPDPGVPYTIIAGDHSFTPAALQPDPLQNSPLQRLVKKLLNKPVDQVVKIVFFNEPNDIAVNLTSIKAVYPEQTPKLTILDPDAACDHFTYFTNPEGLKNLAKALYPVKNSPTASEAAPQGKQENRTPSTVLTQASSNLVEQPGNQNRLNSFNIYVVGAIVTLITAFIIGVLIWKRPIQEQPAPKSDRTSLFKVPIDQTTLELD